MLFIILFLLLFLFAYRPAEISEFTSKSEVFAVSVSHKTALLEIKLTLAVNEAFIGVYAGYFCDEHGVAAKLLCFGDLAFKAYGTFCDHGCGDSFCRLRRESAVSEFIGILAASDAAEVCFFAHSGGGEIYDEFFFLHDDRVGVT